MRYYIISGEASGDLHGANLMKEIKLQDGSADFRCWGGDKMQAEGAKLVKHYKELAFMGFVEVLMNLRTILKNIKLCKEDIEQYNPDIIILIDYPGFNLRIAKYLHEIGRKVYFYISPQVWAWKKNRVKTIKEVVHKMYVILPFEKDFYKEWNYDVEFIGHPLLDEIEKYKDKKEPFDKFIQDNSLLNKPIIALLPGSRKQEITKKLPIMLSVVDNFKDYQFVIAGAPSQENSFYNQFLENANVKMLSGKTYELLQNSYAALVTSGTATLETALFEVPEVVCYKGSKISFAIAKRLVKIDFISLVNLIMGKEVVKELIQSELNTSNLIVELNKILNGEKRDEIKLDYKKLREKLGGVGASKRIATHIINDYKTYGK